MSRLACRQLDLVIGDCLVVRALDFSPGAGECWAVLGPNGVGKTSLLRCLAGLLPPAVGEVLLDGTPIDTLPRRAVARVLGMLQQHTAYAFDARVMETVLTGRHPHLPFWAGEGPGDRALAHAALAAMDLKGLERRSVTELSGGEARRVAAAALMVQQASVMLLDEPTNHLDLRHQVMIMDWLQDSVREPARSAVVALHDVNLASRYCSHALMLFGDGDWCGGPVADMLSTVALERLYGCPVDALETPAGPWYRPRFRAC